MLTVMVGLQGSGKSTKAKELANATQSIVLSSDEIRKEYPEWDNTKVFNYLYGKMIKLLNNAKNVIIDATNTTIKSRKPIFEALRNVKVKPNVMAYIMTTPIEECKRRVEERNKDKNSHFVPLEVIDKYLHSYEIPFYEEGFDLIEFDGYQSVIKYDEEKANKLFTLMRGFNQNNTNHNHTLDVHCELVKSKIEKNGDDYYMFVAAGFHDIGKVFTQTYKEGDPNAHYYNHDKVGTYYLLSNLEGIVSSTTDEIADILFYINYHMRPFNWNTEKAHNRWKEIFGEEKYNNLLIFNKCDKEGSK